MFVPVYYDWQFLAAISICYKRRNGGNTNDKLLTVYPNPSGNGSFTLKFHKTPGAQDITVKLVNESGQVLYSKIVTPAQRLTIESGLSKGAYLM
jgi:hypothetical protein